MPNPKQSGQPSGGMFQKYTGEQINQIPEGYVEGMGSMGKAYQSIGQSFGQMASFIGNAMGQQADADAKAHGQLAPYLAGTTTAIEQGLKSGTLVKGADGMVGPNAAAGITPGMVDGIKIDFYNRTGGDITKLTGRDLSTFSEAFKSSQEIAKLESDRATTQLNNRKTESEISKNEAIIADKMAGVQWAGAMQTGLSAFNASSYNTGIIGGGAPTTQGSVQTKEAPAVKEPGAFEKYLGEFEIKGAFGKSGTMEQAASTASITPIKPGVGLSTTGQLEATSSTTAATETAQTVQAQQAKVTDADKTEMDRLVNNIADYNKQANEAKDPKVKEMALGYSRAEQEKFVELQSKYLPAKAPADQVASTTQALPGLKPENKTDALKPAPGAPSEVQKVINPVAKPAPVVAPVVDSVVPVKAQPTSLERVQTLNQERVKVEAEAEQQIAIKTTQVEALKQLAFRGMARPATAQQAQGTIAYLDKQVELERQKYDSRLKSIDDQIKGIQTEESIKSDINKSNKEETKLAIDVAKESRDVREDKVKKASELQRIDIWTSIYSGMNEDMRLKYNVAPLDATTRGELQQAAKGLLSSQNFILNLQQTLDERNLTGEDMTARFRATTSDLLNWAKADLAAIFGVATFRRGIVSGGNFSDSDRTFVERAIANLNSADVLNNPEVYKAKVKALAIFINGMYRDQFTAAGYSYDKGGMQKMADEMRKDRMITQADEVEARMDTQTKFDERYELNTTKPGTSASASEIKAARETLAAGITDWSGIEASQPNRFKGTSKK